MVKPEKAVAVKFFGEGLALYRGQKFKEARAKFQEGLKACADDGPCIVYSERCDEFIKNPPPKSWDGVYVATTK